MGILQVLDVIAESELGLLGIRLTGFNLIDCSRALGKGLRLSHLLI